VIHVNNSLGNVELYVPSSWDVVKGVDNNMANISEIGSPRIDKDSPIVRIDGIVSMGNLKINYI